MQHTERKTSLGMHINGACDWQHLPAMHTCVGADGLRCVLHLKKVLPFNKTIFKTTIELALQTSLLQAGSERKCHCTLKFCYTA